MPQIDPLHSAFHFPAGAASSAGGKSGRTEKTERKGRFSAIMERKAAEVEFAAAGLPPEIAGMEFEEALVYLKDRADMASDLLKSDVSLDAFSGYRKAVGNLMRFIVSSNYEVQMRKRRRPSRVFMTDKFYLVKVVDEKLDKLAADILSVHGESLQLLSRIEEINGILVDLIT